MKNGILTILLLLSAWTALPGATRLEQQSIGSLSGSMSAGRLRVEAFAGLPVATSSRQGSLRENITFPALSAAQNGVQRIACRLEPSRKVVRPDQQFTVSCVLDFRGSGLALGGYACVLTWDSTLVQYLGHEPAGHGRFIHPQVNENLTSGGQLIFSEVVAEGDTGLIELLDISFHSLSRDDSAGCVLGLKLVALNTALTFQNITALADISPAVLVIKDSATPDDSLPPVIHGPEVFDYTYDTQGPYEVKVRVDDPNLAQVRLHYRRQGDTDYLAVDMALAGDYFTGLIPGQNVGASIEYYFEAADEPGNVSWLPTDYLHSPFTFRVILRQEPYSDYNGDGNVTVIDVLALLLRARSNPGDPKLDWNGDGHFTLEDIVMMVESLFGGGTLLLAGVEGTDQLAGLQASPEEIEYLRSTLAGLELTPAVRQQFETVLGIDHGITLPQAFSLSQNYPNPFNPSTMISFTIPVGAAVPVVISIYDLRSRLVRRLVQGYREPGRYNVLWDGTDTPGRPVASGVYLYRIKAGSFTQTRKMVLLK